MRGNCNLLGSNLWEQSLDSERGNAKESQGLECLIMKK